MSLAPAEAMDECSEQKAARPSLQFKVISLPGSPRRARITEQFQNALLDWSFFDALRELPDGLTYSPRRARRLRGRTLAPGELGCFASHYALWKQLSDDETAAAYCILEDDVVIDVGFAAQLAASDPGALHSFSYIRLYAKVPGSIRRRTQFLGRWIVEFKRPVYGTQGYVISKSAAKQFLSSIREVVRPVDDEIDRYWIHGVPIKSFFPFPLFEAQGATTIESMRRTLDPPRGFERGLWYFHRATEMLRRGWADVRSLTGRPL